MFESCFKYFLFASNFEKADEMHFKEIFKGYIALQVYHQCGSVTNTIRMLGYPTRRALYTWIENEGVQKPPRKALDNTNTAAHPRNPPIEVKMDAIHRCFELGETIKCVSDEIGYSRASIYAWRKKYLQGGTVALMNDKNIKPGALTEGILDPPNAEMQQLLARMDGMQMEIDILKETINVLKKDPGINTETLKNREKAVIVDALKDKYPLPLLLGKLGLPKSSYYYQEAKRQRQDKYSNIRKRIFDLFHENSGRYGYRRIHALLSREGITVSEKVVRRIMAEEGLVVLVKSRRKYNSYQGEISPSVPNTVNRDFHSEKPNEKWLTDVTEFKWYDGMEVHKLYLSAILDLCDRRIVSYVISERNDNPLVYKTFDKAVKANPDAHPLFHSDRGFQYTGRAFHHKLVQAGMTQSMSRVAHCIDNGPMEGFWGILKRERYYGKRFTSKQELVQMIECYIRYYNTRRVQRNLGVLTPIEKHKLCLAA